MTSTRSRHVRTVARSLPSARITPRYDPAHGRLRPDDPDPEMDPAGRPARSPRPRVPARGEARARSFPLPDGERHRVHAQSARPRPHAPEGAARALGLHRLHGLRRGRDRAPHRDRRRRVRPGAQRRGSDRRVRDRRARYRPDGRGGGHRPPPGLARRQRPRGHPGARADQRVARLAQRRRDLRATHRTRSRSRRARPSRSSSCCSRRS